jgi:hypothetical protein
MKQLNNYFLEVVMSKKVFLTLVLIAGLPFLAWFADSQSTALRSIAKANHSSAPSMPSKEAVSAKLATLERGWVKNEGQWDQRALFSAPGYFGTTWVTKDGELLHVAVKKEECKEKTAKIKTCPSKSWVISERWVDGKVQAIKGEEELGTKVSYLIGNDSSKHKSGLSTYKYVSLGEVWSGVEVKLKATQKTVERLFYVKPGTDPSKIQVQLNGAKGLKLSKDGEIIIQTGLGDLKLSKPIAWQEKDGKKLPVEVSYKVIDKNRYSFSVAKADPGLPMVIDPILQSTYLGGSGIDDINALAIHPKTGDVYVAGNTMSPDFPKTPDGVQINHSGGDFDGFVARLNSDLTQILQFTYLGGNNPDGINALAIHPKTGDVYVAGQTYSLNFPNISGRTGKGSGGIYYKFVVLEQNSNLLHLPSYLSGDRNSGGFVVRLSSDLTHLLRSTVLWNGALVSTLAIHPETGDVYAAGTTTSIVFLSSRSAQINKRGYADVFISRLDPDLTQKISFTYLGGDDGDSVSAIAIHPKTGDIYVAGQTSSNNFPKTAGGAQASYGGGNSDVFISRLNSDLTQIIQSTYLGGRGVDWCTSLAIQPKTGDIYVAGKTNSPKLPNITGGAQESNRGHDDVYVARLNSDLTQIIQSTYLGGKGDDYANALAIHPKTGDIYVAGQTASTDFPNTAGGIQKRCGDNSEESCRDAFISRLNSDLTQIIQSTYLGGDGGDSINTLAIHPETGDIYVAGQTSSNNFPKTAGGAQASHGGGSEDGFVTRLTVDLAANSSSDKKTEQNPSNSKDRQSKKKQQR